MIENSHATDGWASGVRHLQVAQPVDGSTAQEDRLASTGLLALASHCPFWCALFLASLLLPTELSIYAGDLRLSPYRIILILAFFPASHLLISGKVGKWILPDAFMVGFGLWTLLVIGYHHDIGVTVQSGGVQFLELLGAYLLARTMIRTVDQMVGMMLVLIMVIAVMTPFTTYEAVSGHHLIKGTAAALGGSGFASWVEPRYGFTRAFGPFDHPILLGVFTASVLGIAWMLFQARKRFVHLCGVGVVLLAALTSVSSGAIVAIWVQLLAVAYERVTRAVPARWRYFWIGLVLSYALIEFASTRSAFIAITTRISFNAGTAYGRSTIFEYGMQNVRAQPMFGLGFNEWERPEWLHESVDNFWLLIAMMYGIPGFLLLVLAVVSVLTMGWRDCTGLVRQLRTGWTVSMAGMVVAAATVHLWNNVYVYFAFLIGCGAVFCTGTLSRRHSALGSTR